MEEPRKEPQHTVFGPVASRRLGMSLGIDLLPVKVCSQDCLYCEVGRTTLLTTRRREFVPARDVLDQVRHRLAELDYTPDYLTLAGSGEPTLHAGLGQVLAGLRDLQAGLVSVLTNSNLVDDPAVRAELCHADVLVPSLDAALPEPFRRVNRPAPGVEIQAMIQGLVELRKEFRGQFWLEVLLVGGVNDAPEHLEALMAAARRIAPDLVQLNTVVRPPAYGGTLALGAERLEAIAAAFPVPAQVIAAPARAAGVDRGRLQEELRAMTRRRPCDLAELSRASGLEPARLEALVAEMLQKGWLVEECFGETTFYRGVE